MKSRLNRGHLMKFSIFFIILFSVSVSFAQTTIWDPSNGPFGGPADHIAFTPTNGIVAAAGNNIYLSLDIGATWQDITNSLPIPNINTIAVNSSGHIFVGGYQINSTTQLYRSIDNGVNWALINPQLPLTDILDIAITSTDTIYISTFVNIFQSGDNGNSWTGMAGPTGGPIAGMNVLHASPNDDILAADYGNMYYTTDNGANWNELATGYSGINAIAVNSSGNIVFSDFTNVYSAPDFGGNFVPASNGLPNPGDVRTLVYQNSGNLLAGTQNSGVYVSTNDGGFWSTSSSGLTIPDIRELARNSTNSLVAGTHNGIFISTNSGSTWQKRVSGYVNTNINTILSLNNGQFMAGCEQGLYTTADFGQNWTAIPHFDTLEVKAVLESSNGDLFAGTNMHGVFRSTDNGVSWDSVNTGLDSREVLTMAMNKNNELFLTNNFGVFSSTDNGDNWSNIFAGGYEARAVLVVANDTLLIASYDGIYRLVYNGTSWSGTSINTNLTSVNDLMMRQDGYYYAGTYSGIYRSIDGGANWTDITGWTGTSRDVQSILVSRQGDLYAATDSGYVYQSGNLGDNWQAFNSGLPMTKISSLALNKDGDLLAGTSGSGILTTTIENSVFSLSPTGPIDFGTIRALTTVVDSFMVTSLGYEQAEILSYEFSGDAAFSTPEVTFTMAQNEFDYITIEFTPPSAGFFSANLSVITNSDTLSMDLQGTANVSILNATPTSLSYDSTRAGNTRVDSIRISNAGQANLNINLIEIAGPDSQLFAINNAPVNPIPPALVYWLYVSFTPDSAGDFTAELSIDSDGGQQQINLAGIGTAPQLTLSDTELLFNNTVIGSPLTRTLTVENTGMANMLVSEFMVTGTDSAFFETPATGFIMAPGTSQDVAITFSPDAVRTYSAELTVVSDGGEKTVSLIGSGMEEQLEAVFSAGSGSLNFSETFIGSSSTDSILITNTGQADLEFSGVSAVISNSAAFNISGPQLITPSQSGYYRVTFSPTTVGTFSGHLIFTSNSITSPDSIILTASAAIEQPGDPILQHTPAELTYLSTRINSTRSSFLQIINEGESTLNISRIRPAGANATEFYIPGILTPVEPLESMNIEVVFGPQTAGEKTAWLIIDSNAPTSPDSVLITATAVQQLVNLEVTGDQMAERENPYPISITLDREFIPDQRRLYYRQSGKQSWTSVDLVRDGLLQYSGTIPSDYLELRGVDYFIEMVAGTDTVTYPALDARTNPAKIAVNVNNYPAQVNMAANTYSMVSFPCTVNNLTMAGIFTDDYGAYNKSRWRLLQYYPFETDSTFYIEYDYFGDEYTISPGMAFWLITNDGKIFDVDSAATAQEEHYIYLTPGWNMIGNPYDFSVNIASVFPELVELPITYQNGSYTAQQTVMMPWYGYWVNNTYTEPITITIPPIEAGALPKANNPLAALSQDEMVVQLSAALPDNPAQDMNNFLGLLDDALDSKDRHDYSEPPPITSDVQLFILDNDAELAGSYKSTTGQGREWNVVLKANTKKDIHLQWQITGAPTDKQLYLFDLQTGAPLRIDNGSYTISGGMQGERTFKAIIGTQAWAQDHSDGMPLVPVDYELMQNHPNPFNPTTKITFQIAQNNHVRLDVYNILGHHVKTLYNTPLTTGSHTVTWDGTDNAGQQVAAGLYFYRLEAGTFQSVKKMILIR